MQEANKNDQLRFAIRSAMLGIELSHSRKGEICKFQTCKFQSLSVGGIRRWKSKVTTSYSITSTPAKTVWEFSVLFWILFFLFEWQGKTRQHRYHLRAHSSNSRSSCWAWARARGWKYNWGFPHGCRVSINHTITIISQGLHWWEVRMRSWR